jgi:hypothetical protein
MPVIQIDAQLSPNHILKAAEQLNKQQLGDLISNMLILKAKKEAPILSREESELLQQVNIGLSESEQQQFENLIDKRNAGIISEAELEALIKLTDKTEGFNVVRLTGFIELANLRQISLNQLLQELGIEPATYA